MVSEIPALSATAQKKNTLKQNKYRKNALEYVDIEIESKKDPKYKTELCTSFSETGFCQYGNKCRFAHGKSDLIEKNIIHPKLKRSDCMTFLETGYCKYGKRCHFRHHETLSIKNLNRSYYTLMLSCDIKKPKEKRLSAFSSLRKIYKMHNAYQSNLIRNHMSTNIGLYVNALSLGFNKFVSPPIINNSKRINFTKFIDVSEFKFQIYQTKNKMMSNFSSTSCSESVSPINTFNKNQVKILDNFNLCEG